MHFYPPSQSAYAGCRNSPGPTLTRLCGPLLCSEAPGPPAGWSIVFSRLDSLIVDKGEAAEEIKKKIH
jgi:hypothetical protein